MLAEQRDLAFDLGQPCTAGTLGACLVEQHAAKVGFEVSRVQSLRPHYAKTLDIWATALEARKDEAIAIQSEEVYERYMKYLTGCADLFRDGYTDICQFTLVKS